MNKAFGAIATTILVALLTVAPVSPANADGGAIHLHMAGKVGQKAVGTTIMAGTSAFTSDLWEIQSTGDICAGAWVANCVNVFAFPGCIYLNAVNASGTTGATVDIWPSDTRCDISFTNVYVSNALDVTIPASGNSYKELPLPPLKPGSYLLSFTAMDEQYVTSPNSVQEQVALTLQWTFTVAADGTFSSISAF